MDMHQRGRCTATPTLWHTLRHPHAALRAFDNAPPTPATLPYTTWAGLTGIAIGGSALYGASLSLVLPRWRPSAGALWLALSAGLGWFVFGPALVLVTRRNIRVAKRCVTRQRV